MGKKSNHIRGALLSLAVALVWVFLASRNPTLHYHFAPLIGAAVWPISIRTIGQRPRNDAFLAGAGSAGVILAATLWLQLADNLRGPNFLHQGPAWPEAVLFVIVGAAFGARVASRKRPGLIGGIVENASGTPPEESDGDTVDGDTVADDAVIEEAVPEETATSD